MKLRFFAFFIVIFTFSSVAFPINSVALENKKYVWVLTDTVEFLKANEVNNFNIENKDTYELVVFGSEGSYTYKLSYKGKTESTAESGRVNKEGDSAAISAQFDYLPVFLEGGRNVELLVEMSVTEDTTTDKSADFLKISAHSFFDKVGAQPDIPSSEAVYFIDSENKEAKLSVGTASGSKKAVEVTVNASAPYGETEGDKISVCLSLRGPVDIGIKYIYEWKLKDSIGTEEKTTTETQEITLSSISGSVNVITSSSGLTKPATENIRLKKGQTIETLLGSACKISLTNGSVITFSENTKLLIQEQNSDYIKIRLLSGKIWANFLVPKNGEMVKVELEHTEFWAGGCIFAAEENPESSNVWNFSNTIFFTASYSGEMIQLQSGQKVIFDNKGKVLTDNFRINEEAKKRGIPLECIIENSGFAWVDKFIYGVIATLLITVFITAGYSYVKKRKRNKRISENEPNKDQCLYCGKELSNEQFCPKCGAVVKRKKKD